MDLGLIGKTAIVTGPASPQGNGRAIALALAREGCDIACLDIDLSGAEDAAGQVRDFGRRSIALKVDQSIHEQVRLVVSTVSRELGPVDILINNAAWLSNIALIENMAISAWERELMINLSGPFFFVKEVLPGMMQRGWGRILNISSIAGIAGGAAQAGYSSTKSGLIGLTKTVALEGARAGVTANILHLGLFDTPAAHAAVRPDLFDRVVKRSAMKRLGTAEEVGDMAAFLVSTRASFITGAEIILDGGQTLFVI